MNLQQNIKNEVDLINYLKEPINWRKHFPLAYKNIEFNQRILGFYSKKYIGIADIIFRVRKILYICEVKFDILKATGDFWDSLKVLGYVANERAKYPHQTIKSVIMIRKEIVTMDILNIIGSLKLSYILFDFKDNILQINSFL